MATNDSNELLASIRSAANNERQQLFRELKPPCIALSKNILVPKPNLRELTVSLQNLLDTLQSVPEPIRSGFDKKIGDYVFFPLSQVFQRQESLNDRAVELALLCLEFLIKNPWRVGIPGDLAKEFVSLLTFIVGGKPQDGGAGSSKRSDETKLAGCRCLLALFESIARSERTVLDEAKMMLALGYTMTTLLSLVSNSSMQELQLASLKTIRVLLLDCIDDEDLRASFYPGIVSALVKAVGLGKTTKQPYQVLDAIIKLLSLTICRIIGDTKVSDLPETEDGSHQERDQFESLKIQRTMPWLKATAMNTKVALENVLKLRAHRKLEVRKAVFGLCRDLLEYCAETLSELSTALVETVLVLAGDEDETLAALSLNTLKVLTASQVNIKESIRDSLHGWIIALPRLMNGNDEDAKSRVITRVAIAYRLIADLGMESDLLEDLLSDNIRESLMPNLSGKLRPQAVQTTIEKPRSLDLLVTRDHTVGEKRIARFPDLLVGGHIQTSTLSNIRTLLELLGSSSENSLRLSQRHIRDASTPGHSATERANSLWVALNLLRGSLTPNDEIDDFLDFELVETSGLQRRVTEELFTTSLFILTSDTDTEVAIEDPLENCLALEALSLIAETRKEFFRGDLIDVLYPVIHHLGASSPQIQNHAIVAVNNIAAACGYSSAQQLLLDNVDYMVNAVSLKLNTFNLSQQAPIVLNMMIKLVGHSLVPYLDDLVVSIFTVLDGYHGYERLCEGLFQALGSIVEETARGGDVAQITAGDEGGKKNRKRGDMLSDVQLIELLGQSKDDKPEPMLHDDEPERKGLSEGFPQGPWGKGKENSPLDEEIPDENEPPPPRDDAIVKVSKPYEIVQRIARLSQHYLTHESYALRIQLLQLISTASLILGTNENEYLPLVNDVWPVVYDRLFDAERHVTIAACNAISHIAQAAGDFLSSRIKDGWVGIKRVYVQAHENWAKEKRAKGGLGVYSLNYKLWDATLKMVVALVEYTRLPDDVLDDTCRVCGGEVLEQRMDLREALSRVAPDAVWLEMESWKGSRDWKDSLPAPIMGVEFEIPVF